MRPAFTLVELLVVIGIIALMLVLLMPTLGRAKELTRRAVCAMNLQGLSRAVHTYGAESNTRLPMFTDVVGNWLWDLSWNCRDALIATGAQRHMYYCPSGLYQEAQGHWEFGGFTVSGYWWFHRRKPAGVGWGPTFLDPKTSPDGRRLLTHLQEELEVFVAAGQTKKLGPADLELSSDATISVTVGAYEEFGYVKGGSAIPHRTSHMDSYNTPAGGNIMFLDGHVAWREFSEMKKRAWGPNHWW